MPDTNSEDSIPDAERAPNPALLPVGEWLHVELVETVNVLWFTFVNGQPAFANIDLPPRSVVICFTYVDPYCGFSAKGWHTDGVSLDDLRQIILRGFECKITWRRLLRDEIGYFELERPPGRVAEFYGPQPEPGSLWGRWRSHPKLIGRFLPDFPDDLQVWVHDGGPRITRNHAEAIWVSTTGCEGDLFQGRILNKPHQLTTIQQQSNIKFMVAGVEHPIMVTDKYLAERGDWIITPCDKCGLSELFDAPSDLMRATFRATPPDAKVQMFSAFCPLCGGVQLVKSRDCPDSDSNDSQPILLPPKPPWWKWWKFWE